MEEKKDSTESRGTNRDAYGDFLHEVSNQFAGGESEKEFMDSIGPGEAGEMEEVHVGERVRAVRSEKGLSLADISRRTDIDVETLGQIEAGTMAPPLGTVIKLAKALEMKMGFFISGEERLPFTIVRKQDRKVISRYDAAKGEHYGYEYESLAPHKTDRHMEPFLVTLEPSGTEEERSTHDGQEFIYVLEGKMEVRLDKEAFILEPGDSIYYDSTVPHLVKCHGPERTRILAVLYAARE